MSEDENKAIRIISCDDKKKNYKTWAKKFLSATIIRGYNIVLIEKDPKDLNKTWYLRTLKQIREN